MPTGSIRVNFERWRAIYNDVHESYLTGMRTSIPLAGSFGYAAPEGFMSITFTQITEIESIRRQIENWQMKLTNQAKAQVFAIADQMGGRADQQRWDPLPADVSGYLRETLCKVTVMKIVKLLDEAEKLGVEVTNEKTLLLDFLKEIAPKDPVP
jgi:hypothetical protein